MTNDTHHRLGSPVPIFGLSERDLRLLDAYYHELAIQASEAPRPNTPDEDLDDEWLLDRARQRAAMTRDELTALRSSRRGPRVRRIERWTEHARRRNRW